MQERDESKFWEWIKGIPGAIALTALALAMSIALEPLVSQAVALAALGLVCVVALGAAFYRWREHVGHLALPLVGLLLGAAISAGVILLLGDDDNEPGECPTAHWTASDADLSAARVTDTLDGPQLGASVDVGARPTSLAIGEEGVWVAGRNGLTLILPDANKTGSPPIDVGHPGERDEDAHRAFAIALAQDRIWVTRRDGKLVAIDRESRDLVGQPVEYGVEGAEVALGHGAVWVNRHDTENPDNPINGTLMRIDPCSKEDPGVVELDADANTVRVDEAVWTTDDVKNQVVRYDPADGEITRIGQGEFDDPQDLLLAGESVWVTDFYDKRLRRIDRSSGELDPRFWPIVATPGGITQAAGALWIPSYESGEISRFDLKAETSTVEAINGGNDLTDIAAGFDRLWVTVNTGTTVNSIIP